MNARDRRQPSQLVHREGERAIDEPMNRERMRRGIDLGYARMMTLEVQRGGRDDAVGIVQRRAARGFFEWHLRVRRDVARRRLEPRPRSIWADRGAERTRLGSGRVRPTATGDDDRTPESASPQKPSSRPLHARLL